MLLIHSIETTRERSAAFNTTFKEEPQTKSELSCKVVTLLDDRAIDLGS